MIKVLVTGDFCPQNRLEGVLTNNEIGLTGELYEYIHQADLSITNLECPITNASRAIAKTGPALKSNDDAIKFLKEIGLDLVTLANNHIMDYGNKGLIDTIKILEQSSISFIGAGNNVDVASNWFEMEKEGVTIAILNFCENEWSTTHGDKAGANPIDPIRNYYDISLAKEKVDRVIVITHGGHEMYNLPSPRMKELFRFYVDTGADVVINHHTHCLSGYEIYKGSPIFYSIGNFLFDHPDFRNEIWNEGMAVGLELSVSSVSFNLIHFNQCNQFPGIELCSSDEVGSRKVKLDQLNRIIQSDNDLAREFDKWVKGQNKLYSAYIEPHKNRYLQALQNRSLFPSLWSNRKKIYLLNLMRCESHRDVLQRILEDDVSNS